MELRGMRYHPIDIETSVTRAHKSIMEWWVWPLDQTTGGQQWTSSTCGFSLYFKPQPGSGAA